MPKEGENILKFNNFHKQQAVPFVIYADFEAITKKVQGCKPNDGKSYTEAYQTHEDCGYGYVLTHLDSLARFDSGSKWAWPNLTQAQLDSFSPNLTLLSPSQNGPGPT